MGQVYKNLFHWRSLLYYKWAITIFFILLLASIYANDNYLEIRNIYTISVSKIDGKSPRVFENNIEKKEVKKDDKIYSNGIILTYKHQDIELIIYKNSKPIGAIYISENSDLRFNFENDSINIEINYGRTRFVIKEYNKLNVFLNTTKIESKGTDFGVLSLLDEKNNSRKGYVIVFDGSIKHTSLNNESNSFNVEKWSFSRFYDYEVYAPEKFTPGELFVWKSVQVFKDSDQLVKDVPIVLEYLNFPDYDLSLKDKEDLTDDMDKSKSITKIEDRTTDLTTDKKFDYMKFLTSFFSVELGSITFNNNIGAKIISRPGIKLFNDKFEFGFYFFLTIIPSKVFTGDMIMNINNKNNEWSFGTDQGGVPEKIVFDVFDDLLLKLRVLRYNKIEDKVFIQAGEYNNISDRMFFSMVDFNSKIFFPMERKTSFVNSYNLPFFQGLLYAEDILPKGLYNISLYFSNPSKSFKFRWGISSYIDCYDLIKFWKDEESFFPAQFNTHFEFVAFDLPTYWFSIYFNGGIFLPFSYNFAKNTSVFIDMINKNPSSIAGAMAFNFGIQWRVKKISFIFETIVDSDINKIGLFDISYSAKRENRKTILLNWITNMNNNQISISEYNFGFRIKVRIEHLQYFLIEPTYQLTFSYTDNNNFGIFDIYYDKLYFRLIIDSKDRLKVNVSFILQWQIESLIGVIADMTQSNFNTLFKNNIFYMGLSLKPHKTVEISLNGGVFPDFSSPLSNVKFLIDINASFKPESFGTVKKK